jgi:hypothetical protein
MNEDIQQYNTKHYAKPTLFSYMTHVFTRSFDDYSGTETVIFIIRLPLRKWCYFADEESDARAGGAEKLVLTEKASMLVSFKSRRDVKTFRTPSEGFIYIHQ